MKIIFYFLLLAVLSSACLCVCVAEELEVEMFEIRSSDPESLKSIVEQLLTNEGKVTYDKRTNNLVVIDTRNNIEKITAVIEQVDPRPRQVRVTVVIADMSEKVATDIGINNASISFPGGIEAVVSLIEEREDASICSESSVVTMSNYPARLQVSSDIILGPELRIISGSMFMMIPSREPIGNILEVLPRVNNDNTIALYVQPTLSTLEKCQQIPFNRSLATQVLLNNEETIVIGGLDSQKNISSETSILGVHSASTSANDKREIVMFLTAEILE